MLITQSGETADTIAAQREAKAKGSKTLAICNVVGSMITREAAGTIYTHAGPEIGVASTKAFTAQLTALYLFALYLAQHRGTMTAEQSKAAITNSRASRESSSNFSRTKKIAKLWPRNIRARRISCSWDAAFTIPIALEGALKLKEVSYIHAEGYPAGEMKHGPNALIDENLPVVIIATRDPKDALSMTRYEKTCSNMKEVKARSGQSHRHGHRRRRRDQRIRRPRALCAQRPEELLPILEIVPLQLLAYHIAVRRGCDVDQPQESGEVGDGGVADVGLWTSAFSSQPSAIRFQNWRPVLAR